MHPSDVPARERIVLATLHLLDVGGIDAVSTRAVADRAGVQAPAIYRLYGDKVGLLEAAAERAYSDWVSRKSAAEVPADPVEAIRSGWDDAVRFGLDHPAAYRIAQSRSERGPSIASGHALLMEKVVQVARAGRLAVTAERACALLHAAGRGVTLTLIDTPPHDRDMDLSSLARESTIAAITADPPPSGRVTVVSTATALRSLLPEAAELEPAERQLMSLWLDRIASAGATVDGR